LGIELYKDYASELETLAWGLVAKESK